MLVMKTPVENRQQIFERIGGISRELRDLGVLRIGLFGSFVRGDQNDDSDVDLLLDFEPAEKNFNNFMMTAFLLEDVFGRRVDAVTRESLSPYIGPKILQEIEYGPIDQ